MSGHTHTTHQVPCAFGGSRAVHTETGRFDGDGCEIKVTQTTSEPDTRSPRPTMGVLLEVQFLTDATNLERMNRVIAGIRAALTRAS